MLQINNATSIAGSEKYNLNGESYYVNMAVAIHETLHCVENNSRDNGFADFQIVHNAEENGYFGDGCDFLNWYHDLMTDNLKTGKKGFSKESFMVRHKAAK
jgi:hypothetical protein